MLFDPELLRRCWFLAGPTASGKSAVALLLAPQLDAEIVCLDSMTLYRGLDVGTAKPTSTEQQQVRHHLLDLIDPAAEYTVAEYVRAAAEACQDIVNRGKRPLFVGGSGLYLRSLLRGLFEGPAADWDLRQKFEQIARNDGEQALHDRLRTVDPLLADKLHPRDVRRVIRGLEVYELTGVPLSTQQAEAALPAEQRPAHVYWLEPDRDWLHERIDRRVVEMMDRGLVGEVQELLDRGPGVGGQVFSRTASQALGYAEVLAHLSGGPNLDETIALIQQHTRQFAKRQCTWFRNLEECRAVAICDGETSEAIASRLLERFSRD